MASQAPGLPPGFVLDTAPQPSAPSAPPRGFIPGTRVPPPQTPTNAARDEVGLQHDRAQLERDRIQMERDRLQLDQTRRTSSDPAGDAPATQRRDAGFYLRAHRADDLYRMHQVEPRGVVGQTLADAFPRIGNATADSERQQAEAAQADFIGATLRYESGAAVPPAEFEMQRSRYFPQPGDSPETIAFKAGLRRNAIEALQRSAGPAANGIDTTIPEEMQTPAYNTGEAMLATGARALQNGGQVPAGTPPTGPNQPPGPGMGQVGALPPLTDVERANAAGHNEPGAGANAELPDADRVLADRQAGQATALARQGASADQIDAWLRQQGLNPLSAEGRAMVEAYRQRGQSRRFPGFSPNYPVRQKSQQEIVMDQLTGRGGASEAAMANALDSASLGLPGLFSEDYRNRLADTRENHPVASTVGAIAGGLFAPGGARAGMGLLEQSARTGAQGAVYGFTSSGGDPENALLGGAIGTAAPGAFNLAGRAARGVRNALLPASSTANPEARAVAQALADEGVPGSRPLVDSSVRDRMAYLESSTGSGGPIRQGLNATRSGVEQRAGQLGVGGTAEEVGTMGERVQDAGRRYIDQSRTQAGRLYDRAANLAGDTPVQARDAVAEIDSQIAQLQRNPNSNAGEIRFLESLRSDFVDGQGNLIPKTVADIRDIRTGLRGRIGEHNLTYSRVESRVMDILDRARGDVERDLGGAGSPAVQAYRRADEFYAQRANEIKQVVQYVIGPRDNPLSGEQVMTRLRTMASNKGNISRLTRMLAHFTPEERADLAATIAEGAGRRGPGEVFQPGQFVAWARTLSPRARAAFFGQDGARSIENLSRISQALAATEGRLNNSRSGLVANWRGWLRDLTGGGPIGAIAGLASGGSMTASGVAGAVIGGGAALTGLGLRRLSAKAMMNPNLSRWLAAAPRATTSQAVRSHIDRLTVIARANPVIAQEITGLRQALMNAINDNVPQAGRAAASPDEGPDQSDQ